MFSISLPNLFLVSMPSGMEWLWVALVVLLLFGGKKIPELAKGIGKGIRDFNDAKKGVQDEIENGMKSTPTTENNAPKPTNVDATSTSAN